MNGDRHGFAVHGRTRSITPAAVIGAFLIGMMAVCSLSGCAGSEKSKFYTLEPLDRLSPTRAGAGGLDVSLGIGPVTIPEYLNRPQIVTRSDRYEIDIADFDRWAETLDSSIPRVLAENLAVLLSTDRIYTYPWREIVPDYQARIDVIRFDGRVPGNVELTVRWTLLKGGQETRIVRKKFYDKKPIAGQGYSGMVSAMSLTLYDLSREIAESVMTEAFDGGNAGAE